MAPAKILFLDIETAPSLGWVWGKWQQNVIDFKERLVYSIHRMEVGYEMRRYRS